MEQIKFTQAQINELYLFAGEVFARFEKRHPGRGRKLPVPITAGEPVNYTEEELFDLARNFNPRASEEIFRPITEVATGESIIFIQEGDDSEDFTDLPKDPQHAVLAAQLMLFLVNYGVNNVMAESLRLAKVRAAAMAKLTPEEIAVLGL